MFTGLVLLIGFVLTFINPTPISAEAGPPPPPPIICDKGATRVNTALGCISIAGSEAIINILRWSLGIAGLFALGSTAYAAFLITTSGGDPKRAQAGSEMVTASLSGLFLIACSVVILNFIGLNILDLGTIGFDVPK